MLGKLLELEDLMGPNPEYIISRYPGAANGVPAQMYNEAIAERQLERASRVIRKCRELMGL